MNYFFDDEGRLWRNDVSEDYECYSILADWSEHWTKGQPKNLTTATQSQVEGFLAYAINGVS